MINGKLIKVCGMSEAENIRQVEELGVDMIGFIFYPRSPRYVYELPGYLPERAQKVGVFVNESKEEVQMIADRFGLDYVQLHGNESPGYCRSLKQTGLRLIKAFSMETHKDLHAVKEYTGICDYYLFDTKTQGYGGSGKQFEWSLLYSYKEDTPFLLSGGITPQSGKALNVLQHPRLAGFDINSCFETAPARKNIEHIRHFLRELK
ncbi:MAG: phosphoribosylanthranilate isomerase [Bacteroides sp.]|nr:phosphoribosylanthranilate isomerase [Bacteroides sp.]